MSGRIRTIKPELLEDAVTAGLGDSAFRLFIGLILLADDYGNMRAEPRYLEGQIYWSAIPEKSVATSCKELGPLVTFYKVRGQLYAHINGWEKHQKISHKGNPRVPRPEDRDNSDSGDFGNPPESLRNLSESLLPDLRSPTTITDHEQEQQGAPEGLPSAAPAAEFASEPKPNSGVRVAATPSDPDIAAVVEATIANPKLSHMSRSDIVAAALHAMPVGKRLPRSWYLASVAEAAVDAVTGESPGVTLKRYRQYLASSKAPKNKSPDREVEPDRQAIVWRPPANAARIDVSKIGIGGAK